MPQNNSTLHGEMAYAVFRQYIVLRMELPFFSNARTVRNAMDRARMNSAIRVFDKFAIRGTPTQASAFLLKILVELYRSRIIV
jgi:dTDP-4-dehydrorhamnose reductase